MIKIMQETICGIRLTEELKDLKPLQRKKVLRYFTRVEQIVDFLDACPDDMHSFMYDAIYTKLRSQIDNIVLPEKIIKEITITLSGIFRKRNRKFLLKHSPTKRNIEEAGTAHIKHDNRLKDWKDNGQAIKTL